MKNLLVLGAIVLAVGCGQQNGNQTASGENQEGQTYGSSTDFATNAMVREDNPLNTADNGMGGPVQREAGNYQQQPNPAQTADNELEKAVKVAITTGSTGTQGVLAVDQLTKIQVAVQNGVVTLSGPVASEDEKRTIEKQVAGMKGVQSVQNNLTVGGNGDDRGILYPRGQQNGK